MLKENRITHSFILLMTLALSACFYIQIANADVTESPIQAWIDRNASSGYSGAVLVSRGGDILVSKGFGLADKESGKPYTADTVVDILSITKQFTAAAILKLQEQGALSVNDPVTRFFDDVPDDKKSITLHHLLTHTSGLKDSFEGDYSRVTRDDLERSIWKSRLLSVPGEEYSYSNVGYGLLGIVIEKVSGKSYEAFLNENLFQPAGMKWTGYRLPEWEPENFAVGYRSHAVGSYRWLARLRSWFGAGDRWGTPLDQSWADDGPWWSLRANGGILSTLNDLHRWHLALEDDVVLSASSKNQLYFPHVRESPDGNAYYAYGWVVSKEKGKVTQIYHDGGNPYFFSFFYRSVEHNFLLLFSTNTWGAVRSGELKKLVDAAIDEYSRLEE